ncbi:MAG: type II toxin-antitoxin system RelE/ParE family toxin [Sedimentisphaerales bacterium]|nr:type II toxin-antitoxin system RelE/ParE family toxin [Sedimentisphaerales bacterium]
MVIWSRPAKDDLKRIFDYIASDSKYYAVKVSQEFIDKSEQLVKLPQMGRTVPEIEDSNIRELIIYSYRLIYEISSDRIEILTIIHGKQDFSEAFEKQRK